MAKGWALAGKTLSDFSGKVDYTVENAEDRLELVRNIVGEQPILHNGETIPEEYEVKSSIVVKDWSKRDRNYDSEIRMKAINKYDDFFPEYFSSTPKFSMDRVEKFEEELAEKRNYIEQYALFYDDEKEQYEAELVQYKEMTAKGIYAEKPRKPKMPKLSNDEIRKEEEVKRLRELLQREDGVSLSHDEIDELRTLKTEWMYNGEREGNRSLKEIYDYSKLDDMIVTLSDIADRDKSEEKQLNELLELRELLNDIDLTAPLRRVVDDGGVANRAYKKLIRLSKKYAEVQNVVVNSSKIGDKTVYRNYTPFAGTTNKVNEKQVVSNLKPLSEHDYVCKTLQAMGTYLIGQADNVYPPEKELSKDLKENEVQPRKRDIFKSRKFKVNKNEGKYVYSPDRFERNKHESKFPKFFKIDRGESREEAENKMSKLIADLQIVKKKLEEKKATNGLTRTEANLYKGINEDAMEIMHSKHRFIKMRMLLTSSTEINYDEDTGYVDANGKYVHISYNAISFFDPKHVAGFVTKYKSIKDFGEDREHGLYYHVNLFVNLFNKIVDKLSEEEKQILDWSMLDGIQVTSKDDDEEDTILKRFKKMYDREISKSSVSKLLHQKVPKLIVEQYENEYEDFIYTYKIKGNYHTCTKCKTPKLAIKKYFGKDSRNKNGLKSICKVCDKSKK